jgi:hypothetical protein
MNTAIQLYPSPSMACKLMPSAGSHTFPIPSHRTGRAVLPHPALGLSSHQAHEMTTRFNGPTGAAHTPDTTAGSETAAWIDELVFPEGWEAALKLRLDTGADCIAESSAVADPWNEIARQ